MFLKQIKIIGFKSFVEPTIIEFRSDRVAIVGPNGCGKSNVIDAIRWVMGESSPKFLRGDLMADVIFNGSLHRKPMGLASVEIILDNTQNLLQGAYVKKGDVSLRREVNRSGDSSYFINQQRVRRKDLSDLWLGTGAGARGYAIIGQNMVNQLVEANPEALKAYLEEAAGVSKYKERRKESAIRLAQITENIARISDIVHELAAQLIRLEKEACDARQYQALKQQLKQDELNLQYLKLKNIENKQNLLAAKQDHELEHEQALLAQISLETDKLKQQEELILNCQDALHTQEQAVYQLKLNLSQQEQLYAKQEQDKARYHAEKETLLVEINTLQQETVAQENVLDELRLKHHQLLNHQAEVDGQIAKDKATLLKHELSLKALHTQKNEARQQGQKIETKRQVLAVKLEQTKNNLAQYQHEIKTIDLQQYQQEIDSLNEDIANLSQQIEDRQNHFQQHLENQLLLKAKVEEKNKQFQQTELNLKQFEKIYLDKRKALSGAEASYQGLLAALQENASGLGHELLQQWLNTWQVPAIWQGVVDFLWQHFLPHGLVESLPLELDSHTFISKLGPLAATSQDTLLTHFGITHAPSGFFNWSNLKYASTTAEAMNARLTLQPDESILTPEGLWLGRDWQYQLSFAQAGLATRLQIYKDLSRAFQEFESTYHEAMDQFLSEQKELQHLTKELQTLEGEQLGLRSHLESLQQKKSHLWQKKALFEQEKVKKTLALEDLEARYAKALVLSQNSELELDEFNQSYAQNEDKLKGIFDEITQEQAIEDKITASLRGLRPVREALLQDIVKNNTQLEFVSQELPKLSKRQASANVRLQQVMDLLATLAQEKSWPPQQIAAVQAEIQAKETALENDRAYLKQRQLEKQNLQTLVDKLKKQEMQSLEKKWQLNSQKEQLELERQLLAEELSLLGDDFVLPKEDESYFKHRIMASEKALVVLGDVNLLALGLYEEERIRHDSLLAQQQDLQNAMTELQIAIETLDVDMQSRLEQTLKAINQHLLEIFPQLFGGGQAKFVASCGNLLEATVSVQVQLPGKKQHRIQLLSGGEKALTAVALLFAIFSLNPAPFCLLDEVDAALDDANVGRLANLIKKLSETVQFVLITHNPLTMDAADDLVGVTMQEPGVSRVVSVNMAMALEMVNKE